MAEPKKTLVLETASEPPPPKGMWGRIKGWLKRNERLLWWGHSVWAMFLGLMVILFAAKGFDHARILAATLGGAFLVMVVLFRVFGQGAEQKVKVGEKRALRISFLGMTYVLKNLYQGMLFFVLPFYWKSSALDSINAWFVFVLGALAILSTLDLVFDNLLMRYKVMAAIFYAVTLFACMNLVLPAFLSNIPTLVSLLASTALSVFAFWLLHFPLGTLREKRTWITIGSIAVAAMVAMYFARVAMPPVPLYVTHAGVGLGPLPDGRLEVEVTRIHKSRLGDFYAVSDVVMPGGEGDSFRHVWRHATDSHRHRADLDAPVIHKGGDQTVRVRSQLPLDRLSAMDPVGDWVVDIVTTDDQIVGRTRFKVIE